MMARVLLKMLKKGEMIILKIRFEDSDNTKRKPLNIDRMTIEEEK